MDFLFYLLLLWHFTSYCLRKWDQLSGTETGCDDHFETVPHNLHAIWLLAQFGQMVSFDLLSSPPPSSQFIAQINTVVLLSLLNYIFCWFVVCFFFWVTLKAVKRNEMEFFPLFFFFLSNVFPFAASLCWHGKCFALLTDKSPKCLNQRLIVEFVERLGKK